MDFNDIKYQLGSVNPSGIGDQVFYIAKRNILAWPTITDNILDALMDNGYVQFNGNFILPPGAVWHRIYNTQGKGKVSWEYTGETDCKVVVNKATLPYPKITDEARAFAKFAANGDFVFCIKHDKKYYIIGSKDYRAIITPNGDSGDAPGSAKGMTVDVESPDATPLPVYTGKLYFADGSLDCETDTFINYNDMNTNKLMNYSDKIANNTLQFEAEGLDGRIHLEGSGPILLEVGLDRENYVTVEHDVEFENGVAIVPISFYIGDQVRLSATTLTKVVVNWNHVKTY